MDLLVTAPHPVATGVIKGQGRDHGAALISTAAMLPVGGAGGHLPQHEEHSSTVTEKKRNRRIQEAKRDETVSSEFLHAVCFWAQPPPGERLTLFFISQAFTEFPVQEGEHRRVR